MMYGEEGSAFLPVKLDTTKILDTDTRTALQLNQLGQLVDQTITRTGHAFVQNVIDNPCPSAHRIQEKQDALRELGTNDALRQKAADLLKRVQEYEGSASDLFSPSLFTNLYDSQKDLRTIITSLPDWATEMPEPFSPYMRNIKNAFLSLRDSAVEKLAKGPIFRSLHDNKVYGLAELVHDPKLVSPLPFHSHPIKVTTTLPGAVVPGTVVFSYVAAAVQQAPSTAGPLYVLGTVCAGLGGLIGYIAGKDRDRKHFLSPMTKRFANEPEAQAAFHAIGKLDELLSYDAFGRSLAHACIPEISDKPNHEFSAKNLINAIQSKRLRGYVPNNVVCKNGQPLTFITGPNSGGKTSLGKSMAQAQILAQMGCYVPADWARISVADKIFYQVGTSDDLDDDEGGLGAQFAQTKDILFSSTPRSLVIIDDLIEGTTFKEKTRHTRNQLYGFMQKGPTTIYISHHYELAQEFKDKGVGNFLQVEFDGVHPTHRIIPGISTDSHSELVAKRTGFDELAIQQHLVAEGYLNAGRTLQDISDYVRPSLQQ